MFRRRRPRCVGEGARARKRVAAKGLERLLRHQLPRPFRHRWRAPPCRSPRTCLQIAIFSFLQPRSLGGAACRRLVEPLHGVRTCCCCATCCERAWMKRTKRGFFFFKRRAENPNNHGAKRSANWQNPRAMHPTHRTYHSCAMYRRIRRVWAFGPKFRVYRSAVP